MSFEKGINERRTSEKKAETQQWFQKLIQQNEYVGELHSINYETARVIIHDSGLSRRPMVAPVAFGWA